MRDGSCYWHKLSSTEKKRQQVIYDQMVKDGEIIVPRSKVRSDKKKASPPDPALKTRSKDKNAKKRREWREEDTSEEEEEQSRKRKRLSKDKENAPKKTSSTSSSKSVSGMGVGEIAGVMGIGMNWTTYGDFVAFVLCRSRALNTRHCMGE
jgi:hypothetical protein